MHFEVLLLGAQTFRVLRPLDALTIFVQRPSDPWSYFLL